MPPARLANLPPESMDHVGRFCLAAEATKLLGKVFQHVQAKDFDSDAHIEEARLLESALRALENVIETDGHEKIVDIMNQAAICSM